MTELVTKEQLIKFAPAAITPGKLATALSTNMKRCEINTPRRIRHFMAHLHHESMGFARVFENLSYSADRLMVVWPKRFPNKVRAQSYARNPQSLANFVYGGRMGNVAVNDGWKYRGRGFIQLTGKDNYREAAGYTGLNLLDNPDLAADPTVAAQIACDFWRKRGLNKIVDEDNDEQAVWGLTEHIRLNEEDDLREGTKRINGGYKGLEERRALLRKAASIWLDQ